jgi:predicted nucleic acid-binding protein
LIYLLDVNLLSGLRSFMGMLHGPLQERVTDAHLAALAQEQQPTLCSHDGGFRAVMAYVKVLDPIGQR